MEDFRGITPMSVTSKIYNRMLLNRIYEPVNALLRPEQAGSRRGRSCTEQIHTLTKGFARNSLWMNNTNQKKTTQFYLIQNPLPNHS